MKKFGIDVSRWQGDFDFNKAKEEGVTFVIIKCGGADGGLYKDPMFEKNYKNAAAAGLEIGTYFFGNASNVSEAIEEAKFTDTLLKNKKFSYPVFYDVESEKMGALKKESLTKVVKTFCNYMESTGYWCGFYTNYDWYLSHLNGPELAERYSFWFAFWGNEMIDIPNVQMWQFGASVNVIRSNIVAGVICDQNYCFVDYPKLIKEKGKNGYKAKATSTNNVLKLSVGDKIKIKNGAVAYGIGVKFLDFVYTSTYYVLAITGQNNDRIVFGPQKGDKSLVTGAVDKKYVIKCS